MNEEFQLNDDSRDLASEKTHQQINVKFEDVDEYHNDSNCFTYLESDCNLHMKIKPSYGNKEEMKIQEDLFQLDGGSDKINIEEIYVKTDYVGGCDDSQDSIQESNPNINMKMEPLDEDNNQPITEMMPGDLLESDEIKIEDNDVKTECFGEDGGRCNIVQELIQNDNGAQHRCRENGNINNIKEDLELPCNANVLDKVSFANYSITKYSKNIEATNILNIPQYSRSKKEISKQSSLKKISSNDLVCSNDLHTNQKCKLYVSNVCKKGFTQTSNLNKHKLVHTGEKPHICEICQKQFTQFSSLNCHKLIHTGEKRYICDICQKQFTQLSNLRRHKLIHTNEKPYVCEICQKQFSQLSNLTSHKLIHTGEKRYTCDICKKQFTQLSSLNSHKRIHTGEKLYICDICKKKFTQLGNLNNHKLIHISEKRHVCDVCQKQFTQLSNLNSHRRIHTGEKPYVCDICNKRFTQTHSLNSHKRIHTGEKPYFCDICKKQFTRLYLLNRHKLIHTSEKL